MRTTTHTPGPWHWEHGDLLKPALPSLAGIATILEFDGTRVERDCDIEAMQAECDANRRLIAAAPELAMALHSARRVIKESRESLYECHLNHATGRVDDCALDGLAEYDAALAAIDAALTKAGVA